MSHHAPFLSPCFHYTFGPHQPTIRIAPGASLRITCPDSDNELSDGSLLSPAQRQIDPALRDALQGNPLAGPIHVEGAQPGDRLLVRIDAIHLDRRRGQTGIAPDHGLLPSSVLAGFGTSATDDPPKVPRHLYVWDIDTDANVARLTNPLGGDVAGDRGRSRGIAVPLSPFVGCVGTCPATGSVSAILSGAHGGNMDIPELARPGTMIELPVFRDGALLLIGDIHAAQGHGEIIGGAIETSGQIDCTIDLLRAGCSADRPLAPLPAPRGLDGRFLTAVGLADDLREAVAAAYAHLLDWLSNEIGMNRFDACNLISQTASIAVGNLLEPPYPVAARIPLRVIPDFPAAP